VELAFLLAVVGAAVEEGALLKVVLRVDVVAEDAAVHGSPFLPRPQTHHQIVLPTDLT